MNELKDYFKALWVIMTDVKDYLMLGFRKFIEGLHEIFR